MGSASNLVRLATLAAASLIVACGSASDLSDRIAGHRASPFALFGRDDMRAGLRLDALRKVASKESVKQYECMPLWVKAQRCSLAIETGMLTAVVDSTGRVIRLLASTDPVLRNGINVHGQLIYRDVVRDLRLAWDSVATARLDDSDPDSPEMRWIDRTQRWGGDLWYTRLHRASVPRSSGAALAAELAMSLPDSIGVTDMPAYALFAQRRPASSPLVPRSTKVHVPSVPPTIEEIIGMMRSDLREITIAEEEALHRTGSYEDDPNRLQLTTSDDVRLQLVEPTGEGWSAIASHPRVPGVTCVVYAGNVVTKPATAKEGRHGPPGEIVCDRP